MSRYQQGMSTTTLIVTLIALAFVALCAIKIGPHYMEYYSIKKMVADLPEDDTLKGMTPAELRGIVSKRLDMNRVKIVDSKDFYIKEGASDVIDISVEYQVEQPMMGNVSVLLDFATETTVRP